MWRVAGMVLALAGCTAFPELDRVATPGVAEAPFPELVPLERLLEASPPRLQAGAQEDIAARVAALRARAARLGGPVIGRAELARMRAGVGAP